MADCVLKREVAIAADFAAGDGQLLSIAAARWSSAVLVGTDIDPSAVRGLQQRFPEGSFGRCDFLKAPSRRSCAPLRGLGADVILLNPPFSCRGAKRFSSVFEGVTMRSSLALAFLVTSLSYLADDGVLVAVLPSSATTAQRDRSVWSWLVANGIEVVAECERRAFEGVVINALVVRTAARPRRPVLETWFAPEPSAVSGPSILTMYRGKLPRHVASQRRSLSGLPYVHTTDIGGMTRMHLYGGTIRSSWKVEGADDQAVSGPCVLVPRVGSPESLEPVLVASKEPFVLSDCLYALRTVDVTTAERLYRLLKLHWSSFSMYYSGSGAQYLTHVDLATALAGHGYGSVRVTARNWVSSLPTGVELNAL